MNASKIVLRTSARVARPRAQATRQNIRFASTEAKSSGGGFAAGLIGGVVGASALGYGYYHYSGAGQAVKTAQQVKSYADDAINKFKLEFKKQTPDTNEAIEVLRKNALQYAVFIPGGKDFVAKAFDDVEKIKQKHGKEVDKIVSQAYDELRSVSEKGLSLDTATESWNILTKYIGELSSLAVDAGQDLLDNHPDLKNKFGDQFNQLKQLGDKLGPDAKKQVEQTYKEVQDLLKGGLSLGTVDKVKKIIEEKTQQIKKLGDQAWQKGLEEIQPLLKKNPKIQQVVEENKDILQDGNIQEGVSKVKEALKSGDTGSLEEYLKSAKDKASSQLSSDGINKWLSMIPGGSAILPQLEKLRHLAEKQGPKAEKLAKETMDELAAVFEKKKPQIEELYNETQKETKK